jgi:NTE family protein
MVLNLTMKNFILPSSRLLFSVNIAENPGLALVYNRKIGQSQHWSDELFLNMAKYKASYYETGEQLGNYKRTLFELGYGINYSLGLNQQIGAKAFFRNNRYTPQADLYNIFPDASFKMHTANDWCYSVFYKANTTDHLYFPKKGMEVEFEITHAAIVNSSLDTRGFEAQPNYFLDELYQSFATLDFKYNWYKTFAKRFTYNFGLDAGFNTNYPGTNGMFVLGGDQLKSPIGFKKLAGYNFAELYTYNYSFMKSALNVEVFKGLYLSGTLNVGNVGNTMKEMVDQFSTQPVNTYQWGYSVGLKYDSLIGSVQLLFADNNMDNITRFHFSIGFPF